MCLVTQLTKQGKEKIHKATANKMAKGDTPKYSDKRSKEGTREAIAVEDH